MASNTESRLLQLPAELRNDIFALALEDFTIDIDGRYYHVAAPPGIVFACKQTYRETIEMYYSRATIVSQDRWIINQWLLRLCALDDAHRFKLMKRIRVDFRNRSEHELPLDQRERYALSQHTSMKLTDLDLALMKLGGGVDAKACIVSPSQELVWTSTPYTLHEWMQKKWSRMTEEARTKLAMEEWAPSGSEEVEWTRR